jgi:hypothetical protein
MTQHYQVVYETKGVKVINVWLSPEQELPEQWKTMTYAEQDEWLYEHQVHSNVKWTDEYKGEAVNVLPVLSLKLVISWG